VVVTTTYVAVGASLLASSLFLTFGICPQIAVPNRRPPMKILTVSETGT